MEKQEFLLTAIQSKSDQKKQSVMMVSINEVTQFIKDKLNDDTVIVFSKAPDYFNPKN